MRKHLAGRWIALISGFCLTFASFAAPADAAMATPRLKPPAPGPSYITRMDLERVRGVRESLARKRFSDARSAIPHIEDVAARTLAQWYYFDAEDPQVSITEVDAYLDANPEWPSATKIQMHAERQMSASTPAATVLAFFDSRDPVTGEGKLQLARAQFNAGSPEAGVLYIKDAWINNNFRLADEQRLLAQYGGRLSPDDHAARVDRLLWSREVTNARRVFSRLSSSERRKAETRAALLVAASNAPRLYDGLPAADRDDAGVMLAAIRYFRRAGEEMRAIAIARNAPFDPVVRRNPARWWDEQQLLMRWALKNRQYADAYAMAANHALEPGTGDFADAEFDAGWIALRYLNDPARAQTHFAALTASVGAPISLSRGWYWLARAAQAQGDTAKATEWFAQAAQHSYSFYGQLAAEQLGAAGAAKFEEAPPATPAEKARFGARPAVAALRMLTDVGDDRAFLIFSYHLDDVLESRGEFLELNDLAMRMDAPHVAVRAGKVAVRAGAFAPQVAYPAILVPDEASRFTPAEVILGLSRQESEFNPRAYSRAGARGMMQLIPSTAQITARKEGLPYRRSALLDDPVYNMTLGAAHLSHLIDRFDGSYIMTFAAYNAGASRVDQWVETYGDPRGGGIDPLDWMEQIPFEETRNYVQRVLENTQIYRSRQTGAPIAGALSRDIERGGQAGRIGAVPALVSPGLTPDIQPRIAALADPIVNPPPPVLEIPPAAVEEAQAETAPQTPRRGRNNRRTRRSDASDPAVAPLAVSAEAFSPPVAVDEAREIEEDAQLETVNSEESDDAFIAQPDNLDAAAAGLIEAGPPLSETAAEPAEGIAQTPAAADAECLTYSDFIAETAKEEAAAADLNAGALAELNGGATCDR